jgi:hypothetical protein
MVYSYILDKETIRSLGRRVRDQIEILYGRSSVSSDSDTSSHFVDRASLDTQFGTEMLTMAAKHHRTVTKDFCHLRFNTIRIWGYVETFLDLKALQFDDVPASMSIVLRYRRKLFLRD